MVPSPAHFELPRSSEPRHFAELKGLAREARDPLLHQLVPAEILSRTGADLDTPWVEGTSGCLRIAKTERPSALRLEVWPAENSADPVLALELADTYLGQLEISWIAINDVGQPRFNVDRAEDGTPLPTNSGRRNVPEELRALRHGLAPNQVRAGLRALTPLLERIEALAVSFGLEILYVSPLAYHNALEYEHCGFFYSSDRPEIEWIHREFAPGGILHQRLDGSTPFRGPEMAGTVRRRSWAIHDGILGRTWVSPQMFRIVGDRTRISTAPGVEW